MDTVLVTPIDFSQTSLSSPYSPFYAKVIDNLFTPADCARLLTLASANDGWKPAGLSTNGPEQTVHADFRNSDRVLVINEEHSSWIYEKLRPYVEEIHDIPPTGIWSCITGRPGKKQGPTWTLAGVNPRLSFLRYGPGHYFKPHCDGLNEVGSLKSFITLHLYLNDSALANAPILPPDATAPPPPTFSQPSSPLTASPSSGSTCSTPLPINSASSQRLNNGITQLKLDPPAATGVLDDAVPLYGGSTRFWTPDKKAYLDVHPKVGRVLVFQQRMLVHSGEEVTQGVKYTMRGDFMFVEMKTSERP